MVFSPQILENFRRGNADGLSLHFLVVWLLGDVFNILGAVLQGVLLTMIILAVYYTIADIVLLGQCLYYRGFTWTDYVPAAPSPPKSSPERNGHRGHDGHQPTEHTALLSAALDGHARRPRRGSDWSSLAPTVSHVSNQPPSRPLPRPSPWRTAAINALAVTMVVAAGVAGWWVGEMRRPQTNDGHRGGDGHDEALERQEEALRMSLLGQVFGWLCAALYLGSRVPQLLLNWRRKSTEGVSMLFFVFACLGNITYVLSICAFKPVCAAKDGTCQPGEAAAIYGRHILVNLSWLAGSGGTLLLDMCIFVQFFMYNKEEGWSSSDESAVSDEEGESEDVVVEDERDV